MADISYTPTRELVPASPGLITCNLKSLERGTRSVGKTHTALSGTSESVLQRIEVEWSISVQPFDSSALLYWREFEASCANGEEFTLDLSDITGGPTVPFVAKLKRDSFKESRHEHFWFHVSFTAVEA